MTDSQRQQKKSELLEALKEEIFAELDRRIKETEKNFSHEIHHMEEVIDEKVVTEFEEHLTKTKKWRKKAREDIKALQTRISYYRLPYAAMVIAGFMLFWYGTYNMIPKIPFLSNGPTAIVTGLFLLLITGAAHRKLVD